MENDLIRRGVVLKELWYPFDFDRAKNDTNIRGIPAVDAVEVAGATKQAVELIVEERRRQIEEWGASSTLYLFKLMSILGEEFGELCQAVNESCFQKPKHPERGGEEAIVREAVQVAAVAVQVIEVILSYSMDRRREEEHNAAD